MIRRRATRDQHGFTLVEMMIGMVLGLLLLAGVINIFLGGRQSYQLQEGFSRLQENGRFAMDVFGVNMRHAGFKPNALGVDDFTFSASATAIAPTVATFGTAFQVVTGTDNNAASADIIRDGTDTLSFRFRSTGTGVPAPLADCLGATPSAGTLVINTLYVRTPENELHCRDVTGPPQPMLDGVEGMQVLYGVDTDGDFNRTANRYSTAATVTASGDWARIVSVRVALLLSTVEGVTNTPDTTTYILLNNTAVGPFNDRLRRHVFTTTIALRNLLP
ncbi:MAG: PilW family protein [Gammaproteobacteria bacterium]|nr:PilW family protein [Gammaproteobacteria bacterium]